jgi:hypothetical protein
LREAECIAPDVCEMITRESGAAICCKPGRSVYSE